MDMGCRKKLSIFQSKTRLARYRRGSPKATAGGYFLFSIFLFACFAFFGAPRAEAVAVSGTLDSTTYDTGVVAGAQLNSVLWHGSQPADTSVYFQFAVSNSSSGPWNFMGTDGTSNTYFSTGSDTSLKLDYSLFNNFRYFRYRVTLYSDTAQTLSPRVDEIIVNWSP